MNSHNLFFYYPYPSFTNAQLPLLIGGSGTVVRRARHPRCKSGKHLSGLSNPGGLQPSATGGAEGRREGKTPKYEPTERLREK